MLRQIVRIGSVAGLASAFLLAGGSGALAQEEGDGESAQCPLEGSELTAQAEDFIDDAANADSARVAEANYQQALARIRLALRQNEEDAAAYWLAGRAHVGLGDYAKADSMLNRFLDILSEPGCRQLVETVRFQAWADTYNEGIRHYRAGEDSAALEKFEKASRIYEDARSLNNAALLNQRLGNLEKAEELYRHAMEVAEDTEQLRASAINLAELLRGQGKLDETLEMYRQYLEENPDDVTARINFAVGLRDAEMPDSAQSVLSDVMSREGLTAKEWSDVGVTLMGMDATERAVEAFRNAREVEPYNKTVMENLLEAQAALQNFDRAAALADTLVSWYPYQKDLFRAFIQILDRMGNTQRVQQLLPAMQNMPMDVVQSVLLQQDEGVYVVRGQVRGGTASGQTVTLPVELFDSDGNTVASTQVEVQVPAQGEGTTFQVAVRTDESVAGFRYGEVQ